MRRFCCFLVENAFNGGAVHCGRQGRAISTAAPCYEHGTAARRIWPADFSNHQHKVLIYRVIEKRAQNALICEFGIFILKRRPSRTHFSFAFLYKGPTPSLPEGEGAARCRGHTLCMSAAAGMPLACAGIDKLCPYRQLVSLFLMFLCQISRCSRNAARLCRHRATDGAASAIRACSKMAESRRTKAKPTMPLQPTGAVRAE